MKGTITVKGTPAVVTLAASAPVVKYGTQVTLTGTVSTKRAGETVTLVQLPAGQTTKQVLATLQTTTNGVFSFTVTPQITTQYQALVQQLGQLFQDRSIVAVLGGRGPGSIQDADSLHRLQGEATDEDDILAPVQHQVLGS